MDIRMSCASILGQFSRNLRAQTQLWLGPTPFILGTIEFLHHHLTVGGELDDGRTETSGEISSLGVSVYHGISVYPYTINSQVLSYSLKPFTKLPSCVHPISQTDKSHWLASSIFFWSRTSMPVSLGAMSVFTFSTAYSHGRWSILHQALVAAVNVLVIFANLPWTVEYFKVNRMRIGKDTFFTLLR